VPQGDNAGKLFWNASPSRGETAKHHIRRMANPAAATAKPKARSHSPVPDSLPLVIGVSSHGYRLGRLRMRDKTGMKRWSLAIGWEKNVKDSV